jgi:hypothetical protein
MYTLAAFASVPALACMAVMAVSLLAMLWSRVRIPAGTIAAIAFFTLGCVTADAWDSFSTFMGGMMFVLGAGCVFLIFAMGAMVAYTAAPGGRMPILLVTAIVAVLPAGLFGMMGSLEAMRHDQNWIIWLCAAFGFFNCWIPAIFACFGGDEYRDIVRRAPDITTFGIKHFDVLDVDKDRVVSKSDLSTAASRGEWDEWERGILDDMSARFDDIGHKIGSTSVSSVTVIPMGGNLMPMASSRSVSVYVISPDDLRTYPSRMRTKWKRWLEPSRED